jgi:hypothetical protein
LPFQQYDSVRVARLLDPPETYNGWGFNRRPPRVGDVGTIVDILVAQGVPDSYVVESSDPDGVTIWLGDFRTEELEPL